MQLFVGWTTKSTYTPRPGLRQRVTELTWRCAAGERVQRGAGQPVRRGAAGGRRPGPGARAQGDALGRGRRRRRHGPRQGQRAFVRQPHVAAPARRRLPVAALRPQRPRRRR